MIIEIIFWLLLFLIIYTYAIYPLLLMIISGIIQSFVDSLYILKKRERRIPDISDEKKQPTVAVVIAAYNEEKDIVERVKNLLAQDYPKDKLKIYIGSDGSSDKTVDLIGEIKDERIILHAFTENRGKISVLNDLLMDIKESIVVFSDANTFFKLDAVKKLVRHFDDNNIAGVCGELHLVENKTGENKDSFYWRLERILKYHESKIDGFLGANGAIYALRKEHCRILPADTIIDDFTMFMNVGLDGGKIIYDIEAIAEEEVAPDMKGEYGRRVRIGKGNYQAFFRMLNALNPKHKWRTFTYISHKVIRWFTPHFMLLLLIMNLFLLDQMIYQVLFVLQLLLYFMTFVVVKYFSNSKLPLYLSLPVFLVNMNLALAHGFVKYLWGDNNGTWERTER